MSTIPARSFEPEVPRGTATIGKSVLIKGQILSKEDLVIDGNVEGSVEAQENRITIGPNGRVLANIKARDVVVLGQLKGNIEASGRVEIRKGANLVGDIRYSKISIEEGADLRGSLEMIRVDVKPEPVKAAEIPVAKPAPSPERPAQQTLGTSAGGSRHEVASIAVIRKGWNRLFGGAEPPSPGAAAPAMASLPEKVEAEDASRQSSALDQFFQAFHGQVGLIVLDLGVSNQENTDFFNELGHRLRYDNFIRSLDESFGGEGDFYANQDDDDRIEAFQAKVLNFDDDSLDGILVWDSLQYLSPAMVEGAVSQMHSILHKGGQLMTVFHTDEKLVEVPSYSYRIQGRNRVKLVGRRVRKPAQYFTTRSIEKLFRNFDQVKFFLTQDSLREVIVRK